MTDGQQAGGGGGGGSSRTNQDQPQAPAGLLLPLSSPLGAVITGGAFRDLLFPFLLTHPPSSSSLHLLLLAPSLLRPPSKDEEEEEKQKEAERLAFLATRDGNEKKRKEREEGVWVDGKKRSKEEIERKLVEYGGEYIYNRLLKHGQPLSYKKVGFWVGGWVGGWVREGRSLFFFLLNE